MGSHRARHRSDRTSNELATDLLARLAAEGHSRPTRRRDPAATSLDPCAQAPFPARPSPQAAPSRPGTAPRPGTHGIPPSGNGATRCGGTTTQHLHPLLRDVPAGLDVDGIDGDAVAASVRAAAGCAAVRPVGAHRAVVALDALAPFPISPAASSGRGGVRTRPLYAAVSVTVISATAAVAASVGPAFTPASAAPELSARSATPASGALDFVLPGGRTTAPPTPGGGASPTTAPSAAHAPVQGATIVAQATADPATRDRGSTSAPTGPSAAASTTARATTAPPTSAPNTPNPTTPNPTTPPISAPTTSTPRTTAPTTTAPATTTPATTTPTTTTPTTTAPTTTAPTTPPATTRPTTPPRTPPVPVRPAPPSTPAPAARPAPAAVGNSIGTRALSAAKGKLGAPYVWGASGPNAFDCSGLVVWAFRQVGVALPHSSRALSTMGTPVAQSALQPGDLVFFYSPVSHVGIYAGNGMVINATQSGHPVQYTKLSYLPFHNARRITG